jgi:hypothetical protein
VALWRSVFHLTFHWPVWDILLARQGQNEYLFKGFYCNVCPFVTVTIYSMNQTEQFPWICGSVLLNVMLTVFSPWRWKMETVRNIGNKTYNYNS